MSQSNRNFLETVRKAVGSTIYSCFLTFQRHEHSEMNVLGEYFRARGLANFDNGNRVFESLKRRKSVEEVNLSEQGIRNCDTHQIVAKELCEILGGKPDIHIVTPSLRTQQTSNLVWGNHGYESNTIIVDELNERCFDTNGRSPHFLKNHPSLLGKSYYDLHINGFIDGETASEFRKRIVLAKNKLEVLVESGDYAWIHITGHEMVFHLLFMLIKHGDSISQEAIYASLHPDMGLRMKNGERAVGGYVNAERRIEILRDSTINF